MVNYWHKNCTEIIVDSQAIQDENQLRIRMNFYRQRLLNAILYFAKNTKGLTLTKTCKLLFFFDFKHFEETGYPAIGLDYYAWEWGPVPKSIWLELKDGRVPDDFNKKIAIQLLEHDYESKSRGMRIRALDKPDISCFSPRETEILKDLAYIYNDVNSEQISDISHAPNSPWKLTVDTTGKNSIIDYLTAIIGKPNEEKALAREKLEEYWATLHNFNIHR
jgi:uncharacterized phage-associated protein